MAALIRGQRRKVSPASFAFENPRDKAELGLAVFEISALHMVSVLQAEHREIGELAVFAVPLTLRQDREWQRIKRERARRRAYRRMLLNPPR